MTDTALLIGIAYGVAVLLVTALGVGVWLSTRGARGADTERLAERERLWMLVVVAALASLLLATIFFVPYGESAPEGDVQQVRVVGRQFSWQIEPASVRAGVPVEFVVEATDVNHGFGLYDEDDRLVAQVQAMPGKVQRLHHTFSRPGTYTVLCLEFCGAAHHAMVSRLEVTGS